MREEQRCGTKVSHRAHPWPLVSGALSTYWCEGVPVTCPKCGAATEPRKTPSGADLPPVHVATGAVSCHAREEV